MNPIGEILPLSHILLDSDATSKKRLFEQAGLLLEQETGVPRSEVFDCLFAREKLGSTGLGQGVAVPHGRLGSLETGGRRVHPHQDPSPSTPRRQTRLPRRRAAPVPEDAAGAHLEVLAKLAARFADKSVRESLMQAQDAVQVRRILTEE